MLGNSIERIQVVLNAVTDKFKKSINSAQMTMKGFKTQARNMADVMTQPLDKFREFTKSGQNMNMTGKRLATRFRLLTHGMKGFRMEMLGVMFFGMMLKNTFLQLLNPVMEAYGVFDLFREMLLITFLPIMDSIFPIMLQMMEWFMNLSDPVKKAIGVFVILGIILGTILFILGSFALGLGSLAMLGIEIGTVFSALGTAIGAVFSVIGIVIFAILVGILIAWKENFGNIRDWFKVFWEGIKQMLSGAFEVILGLVDLFVSIFKGDFEGIKSAVGRIWRGIINFFAGAIRVIIGLVVVFGIGVFRIVWGIGKTIIGFFKWLGTSIWKFFQGLWVSVRDWAKTMVSEMARNMIWSAGRFIIKVFTRKVSTGDTNSGSIPHKDDFIWRPGQGPISINPNDTLVGFKGAAPNLSGAGGVNFSPTYNINVVDRYELNKIIDDNNRRMVEKLRGLIKQ